MSLSAKKPTLSVPPKTYQPSPGQLKEDLRINTTPEILAKAVTGPVNIVEKRPRRR